MPDSDLEMEGRRGGGGHPDSYKTGGRSPQNLFSALRASVCVKIREGGGGRGGVGSSPESATDKYLWARLMNSTSNKRGKASLVYC